ncbi:microtubule associated protein-domain-containing protein, partial [Jimgerdemannia flammicorona]
MKIVYNPLGSFITVPALGTTSDQSVSLQTITALKMELERCQQEHTRRKNVADAAISSILNLWAELGMSAQNDFDTTILNYHRRATGRSVTPKLSDVAGEGGLMMTEENLTRLEVKKGELEKYKHKRLEKLQEIYHQIVALWEKLSIPEEERVKFSDSNRGCTPDILQAYESELGRLQRLKHEHIEAFVRSARNELKELWDAMYYGERQREEFAPAFSSVMSDECLAAHEAEIERLKAQANENRYILDLIEKHRKLMEDVHEFESITTDPTRFFQRDPGRLLREEKFRNYFARELPRIVKELETALNEYEETKGRPFLMFGVPYLTCREEFQLGRIPSKPASKPADPTPSRPTPDLRLLSRQSSPQVLRPASTASASISRPSNSRRHRLVSSPTPVPPQSTIVSRNRSKSVTETPSRLSRTWGTGSEVYVSQQRHPHDTAPMHTPSTTGSRSPTTSPTCSASPSRLPCFTHSKNPIPSTPRQRSKSYTNVAAALAPVPRQASQQAHSPPWSSTPMPTPSTTRPRSKSQTALPSASPTVQRLAQVVDAGARTLARAVGGKKQQLQRGPTSQASPCMIPRPGSSLSRAAGRAVTAASRNACSAAEDLAAQLEHLHQIRKLSARLQALEAGEEDVEIHAGLATGSGRQVYAVDQIDGNIVEKENGLLQGNVVGSARKLKMLADKAV